MSTFESYSITSTDYDCTRVPIGVDTVLACLSRTGVSLADQQVLEAGCGTGNYLHALSPHLGKLCGIDVSAGMLRQAGAKLRTRVELTWGNILNMPYEDARFDGVTCNQVIHHLDEGPSAADDPADWQLQDYPKITRFTEEIYRILRPGGAFVLNTTSHVQFQEGFWWAVLIPTAVERVMCRLPDVDQLTQNIAEAASDWSNDVRPLP